MAKKVELTVEQFAAIWNDTSLSNKQVTKKLGYEEFSSAYNKKSRAPLNKLCTVKRTETFDPKQETAPAKAKKDSKATKEAKPERAKKAKVEDAVDGVELNEAEASGKEIIVTAKFRKPDGSNDTRSLESENKAEIYAGLQELITKYGNNNANLVDARTKNVIKSADVLYDTMVVNIVRIPSGS